MEPPIPLKSVVLFIACGTMVFIIVFIFAKRQITRFTLRSNRGPHALIGSDVPKQLKQEIDRRLKRAGEIKYEPVLLSPTMEEMVMSTFQGEKCHFFYRMKAVDALKLLDSEFSNYGQDIKRKATQNLRTFLIEQRQHGPLQGLKLDILEKFTDAYDHARHDPVEFHEEQYQDYMDSLNKLVEHIRNKKNNEIIGDSANIIQTVDTEARISNNTTDNVTVSPTKLSQTANGEDMSQVTYRPKRTGDSNPGVRVGILQLTPCGSVSSEGSDAGSKHGSEASTAKVESAL